MKLNKENWKSVNSHIYYRERWEESISTQPIADGGSFLALNSMFRILGSAPSFLLAPLSFALPVRTGRNNVAFAVKWSRVEFELNWMMTQVDASIVYGDYSPADP